MPCLPGKSQGEIDLLGGQGQAPALICKAHPQSTHTEIRQARLGAGDPGNLSLPGARRRRSAQQFRKVQDALLTDGCIDLAPVQNNERRFEAAEEETAVVGNDSYPGKLEQSRGLPVASGGLKDAKAAQ